LRLVLSKSQRVRRLPGQIGYDAKHTLLDHWIQWTVRLMPTDMGCIDGKRSVIQAKIEPTYYTSITVNSEHVFTKFSVSLWLSSLQMLQVGRPKDVFVNRIRKMVV